MLAKAIKIAMVAHKGQTDKAGFPYIHHPLAVMEMGSTRDEMIVGVLHDVVEDTEVTIGHLRLMDFPEHILEAVAILTRHEDQTYSGYIDLIAGHALARRVKINDLRHNLSRIKNLSDEDQERLTERYENALKILDERS